MVVRAPNGRRDGGRLPRDRKPGPIDADGLYLGRTGNIVRALTANHASVPCAGVPGTVTGLGASRTRRFGKLPWKDVRCSRRRISPR
jgi:gamma-glutamyltranspeptidase